ncbi:MAG: hypothetical protein QMD85_03115, partial [Candidatus Aenigmarchaeota archaeon]|nr:hypothetical protein [Candidatus Aenigmarchaeota archaeon]MDI6722522.1 hypothetical protein [Candidatus Aenigmarchaeota archaeon]
YDNYARRIMVDGSHNCYANDLFYIAQRFDLKELDKRRSAIIVVWNGRHKYFEWITHMGFDNAELFADMNLIRDAEADHYRKMAQLPEADLYCFMDKHVEDKLVYKLRLTEAEIASAPLLSTNIWEKEHDRGASGQYSELPWRPDLRASTYLSLRSY